MTDKPAKKFEQYLQEVEQVVKSLEGGKLGLEESIERYEQGIKALRQCYSILEQAEKKIQMLVKEKDGSLTLKDLDAAPGNSPAPKSALEERRFRKKAEAAKTEESEDIPF